MPPGDLYVFVAVRPHSVFEREGSDIYCEVPIEFTEAALGAEVEVPTLGSRASLRIPEGTQTSTVFRLRAKGLPEYGGREKGDQLVRVIVRTPTKLTDRQRKILSELRKEERPARR